MLVMVEKYQREKGARGYEENRRKLDEVKSYFDMREIFGFQEEQENIYREQGHKKNWDDIDNMKERLQKLKELKDYFD